MSVVRTSVRLFHADSIDRTHLPRDYTIEDAGAMFPLSEPQNTVATVEQFRKMEDLVWKQGGLNSKHFSAP